MFYSDEELDIASKTRHIETEQDALAFAIGLLIGYVGERSRPVGLRRLGLETHDVLVERARALGLDLSYYDPIVQRMRDAIAVDGRNIDDVPSGDNSNA